MKLEVTYDLELIHDDGTTDRFREHGTVDIADGEPQSDWEYFAKMQIYGRLVRSRHIPADMKGSVEARVSLRSMKAVETPAEEAPKMTDLGKKADPVPALQWKQREPAEISVRINPDEGVRFHQWCVNHCCDMDEMFDVAIHLGMNEVMNGEQTEELGLREDE